ncbi:S9 family peptidase [Aeromicrobium sp. PE09-221]|uniref:S9 family peptidase n=1 Tax=Aeromicrobium sp. PE09-221 TaxID=1898043 RepID=UPI000B3E951B|nr:S9 family peptidase [Aeromicrobium sp. PE09-221]OUZ12412.1 S9 family peptidase [Aeromicrobium sp. PE09-221]
MRDVRGTAEYEAVETHCRRLHEPAFGRVHEVADVHLVPTARTPLVTGSVRDELEGLPRTSVYQVRGGGFESISGSQGSARHGRYSPDGRQVAYLSDRDVEGEFQLFIADGEDPRSPRRAGRVDGTVEYLHWSPDGRSILLGVAGLGADLSGGQGSGVTHAASDDLPDWHPEVESGVPETAWRSLWVCSPDTGQASRVSPDGMNCWEAQWCGPRRVVAVTSEAPAEDDWYGAVLTALDLDSGETTELLRSDVQLGLPGGSADGRFASVVQAICSDRWVVAGDLIVLDLESGKRSTIDTMRTDVTAVDWIGEHELGYFGIRGLDTVVGTYDAGTGRATERYSTPHSCGFRYPAGSFATVDTFAVIEDAYAVPQQVVVVSEGVPEVLATVSHPGTEYLMSVGGTAEAVTWTAPDGLEIEGMLCVPDGSGPFPLVVNIHGGPIWAFQNSWSMNYPWVPLLVARGYAVLSPNPRGSGGRGQDFAQRVVGDMGGADTGDFLSGVDALVERGIADPRRVGLIGGSYGGFMSSWLVTQDQRFAAAVPISPVTDWYSQSFTSNIAGWGNAFLRSDPEVPGSLAHTRSPVLQASKVRTPCLNVAGALDRCTPPTQAREFHQALTGHGVDSALAIYPQEGHGVRAYPAMIDFLTRVVQWFDTYMPVEPPRPS